MTAITVVCNDAEYLLRHRTPVIDRLTASNVDVTVITGGREIAPSEKGRWSHVFIPIERFSFNLLHDLRLFWRTLLECRAARPEAIHLITLKPAVFSGLAAVLARRIYGHPRRILITIPGLGRLMAPTSAETSPKVATLRWLVERAIAFLSARPDVHFTFETAHDRDLWRQRGLVTDANSTVIPGAGVDPALFFPGERMDRDVAPLKVLFASRLLRSKGLDLFLEVARRVQASGACQFIVAGMVEPHDPDRLSEEALAREGAITFLGEVRDMPKLLRDVDVVSLPTRYGEGIPRILIEASATGLPCLATDVAGCREIIKDGTSGVLVPPGSEEQLITAFQDAVARYVADPALRRAHGRAALDIFRSGPFSEAEVVDRFISLLMSGAVGERPVADVRGQVSRRGEDTAIGPAGRPS